MAKQRKSPGKQSAKPKSGSASPEVDISEDEQWRIVRDSGILNQLGAKEGTVREMRAGTGGSPAGEGEGEVALADEIFNATTLIIPMSFMLFLMEVLVHWQYGRKASYSALKDRMISGIPIISIFIFYTNRYKTHRRMQLFLFLLSMISGTRLIWEINRASWKVVMQQCPPLATLWLYTVIQLDLAPAALGLAVVVAWAWYKDMRMLSPY